MSHQLFWAQASGDMSSQIDPEDLLPNIGELPHDVQGHLRKFAAIAKNAVEKQNEAQKRLQGLENLGRIVQEYQAENVRYQDQFKWYEIILLRTEADLSRTKNKLQKKEAETAGLLDRFERLRVKGQLPKEEDPIATVVKDQADGPAAGTPPDELDQKPFSAPARTSRGPKRQFLAPVFVGVSEDIHNRTLRELEETRSQLRAKVEGDDVTYKEYLDARKSEIQIRKLQETIKEREGLIEKQAQDIKELRKDDKDKAITSLKEENEKHRESDAIKVKVIEASNRRCQELKEENEELRRKYEEVTSTRQDPYQRGESGNPMPKAEMSKDERRLLQRSIEELKHREEELLLENRRVHTEKDSLKRQYDDLQGFIKAGAHMGDEASSPTGCQGCRNLCQQLTRLQEEVAALEHEKTATVAQMKLFEEDFHQCRAQLNHNKQKHEADLSNAMKNIQMLSQDLDRAKEDNQKTRDHNTALEYQMSLLSQQYRTPYYSPMDPRRQARPPSGPVINPGATPWQEGYSVPRPVRTLDVGDGPRDIEADSAAYRELKGEESEEEAELNRR